MYIFTLMLIFKTFQSFIIVDILTELILLHIIFILFTHFNFATANRLYIFIYI